MANWPCAARAAWPDNIISAGGPRRPTCAKISCALLFASFGGALWAHEVLCLNALHAAPLHSIMYKTNFIRALAIAFERTYVMMSNACQ